jgi:putative hydrolase of the HAD superfamily
VAAEQLPPRVAGKPLPVDAVIFDWGGTLTPWKPFDYRGEARALASYAKPDDIEAVTDAIFAAGALVWGRARDEHRSSTLAELCEIAGITPTEEAIAAYRAYWEPATFTDPDVPELWERLRALGVRIGVLSNTIWPREWHREFFERDGVLHLVDGDVYTSEVPWTKPSPRAFAAALDAVGATEAGRCVYVGDRLFDDIWGASNVGMRTILVPHSDIPVHQKGHAEGEPDAVVERLADVYDVVSAWTS